MLFRKIGRQFSGTIHEYMFDEFLFIACMKFESCYFAFYDLRPVCLSTRIEPQDVLVGVHPGSCLLRVGSWRIHGSSFC